MAATIINVEPENEKQTETAPIEDLGKPEQPEQVDKAPQSKFADKSRDEVEKMLTDAQEMIGRQSQEVKDARVQIDALRKTDNFINGQLEANKPPEPKEELDYFNDPEKAIRQSIEDHPVLKQTQEELRAMKQQQAAQQIMARHPDMIEIVQDQAFVDWVGSDNTRMRLFNEANQDLNVDSANYIFDEYKRHHPKPSPDVVPEQQTKAESVKAASTGSAAGSSEPVSKKRYRASDIRKLKNEDPQAYADREKEILAAYAEGRVVRN